MKLYVVTAGEYSDYHICAIFTNKEKAEKYVAIENELNYPYGECWISEWQTADSTVNMAAEVGHYYYCAISLEGEIQTDDDYENDTTPLIDKGEVIIRKTNWEIEVYSKRSFEHAKKVCIEQYQIHTQTQLEQGNFTAQ